MGIWEWNTRPLINSLGKTMISGIDIKDYESDGYKQPGRKDDGEKPPISLIDPEFLEGVAMVLGFGANKYAAHNWRNGIAYSRLISAAYRHLGSINKGEDVDQETGLSHAYHLGCCTMFLAAHMKHKPDLDDRWKG